MSRAGMKLADLVRGLPGVSVHGNAGVMISGMAYDSRRVRPGDLFVAVPGTHADGLRFVPAAVEAGAAAVLAQSADGITAVPVAVAPDARLGMGLMAGRLYGHPERGLTVIAFTGTNGKTTCTYLMESIIRAAGGIPGVIGTIAYRYGSTVQPAPTTTPESVDLFAIIAEMKAQGVTHVIMEASSHALDQKRLAGLRARHAAFTNLTRDHLDYHQDIEEYYRAKQKLFTEVITGRWTEDGPSDETATAAINLDDPRGARLAREIAGTGTRILGFGIETETARVRAHEIRLTDQGLSARVSVPGAEIEISSRLLGRHNLENILTAVSAALNLGTAPAVIAAGVFALERVPGRLEPVANEAGLTVLVDYAHTPDALEHVVGTCRDLARGRTITVFGCGGDRDPGKRPLMGTIAVSGSDVAVITSDNPRTEDPHAIIRQILAGVAESGVGPYREDSGAGWLVEPDRASAIKQAVALARAGDLILIAGKGHEDYQIVGTVKTHFDDREQAEKALREKVRK